MKAVVRLVDQVVQYLFSDAERIAITESGMRGAVNATDIAPETHSLVYDVAPPDLFVGGALSYSDGNWAIVDRSAIDEKLTEYKNQKHVKRTLALEAAREAGFSFAGATVACDVKSQLLIQGAVQLAQIAIAVGTPEALAQFAASLGAGWRAMDGAIVATDAMGVISMAQALAVHTATCDAVSQSIKARIDAATTLTELNAIDVAAGY